jgi:KDO2-lipid IV(A) lauroyltransferase
MAKRSRGTRHFYYSIGYPVQAVIAWIVVGVFAALPLDWASGLGGWIGRTIGPRLRVSLRADRNLRRAMPELDETQIAAIIHDMWDNLGRVVGEMPHLVKISKAAPEGRVEVSGEEHIESSRRDGTACILFSGHFANWEVFALAAKAIGLPYAQVYRAPNNPFVESLLRHIRGLDISDTVPKGAKGARAAVEVLKSGRRLGMLVDQKLNDGIPVAFFGEEVMTASAPADLSLRYGCPAIPARMERLHGCRFRLTFYPPLTPPATGNRKTDAAAMMLAVNQLLEEWIRERPSQWLWLHNRWPGT